MRPKTDPFMPPRRISRDPYRIPYQIKIETTFYLIARILRLMKSLDMRAQKNILQWEVILCAERLSTFTDTNIPHE